MSIGSIALIDFEKSVIVPFDIENNLLKSIEFDNFRKVQLHNTVFQSK